MNALTEETFDDALAQGQGLILVDFWADWCGPCKVVGPILEALEPQYEGRVDFFKVSADENRRLMDAFGIRSLPTVVILRPYAHGPGAEVVGHVVGAQGPAAFAAVIDRALDPKPGLFQKLGKLFGRE